MHGHSIWPFEEIKIFNNGGGEGGGADGGFVRVVVFNATNNNVSVISWRQVLLVEET